MLERNTRIGIRPLKLPAEALRVRVDATFIAPSATALARIYFPHSTNSACRAVTMAAAADGERDPDRLREAALADLMADKV